LEVGERRGGHTQSLQLHTQADECDELVRRQAQTSASLRSVDSLSSTCLRTWNYDNRSQLRAHSSGGRNEATAVMDD